MKTKLLFIVASIGILAGLASVYVYSAKIKPQPPLTVSYNPYDNGIYASGIIESEQSHGSNINIFPEVAGKVIEIAVAEGKAVQKGEPLFMIDDTVQKEIVAKDEAQAQAALTALAQLRAEPRKENLDVASAQLDYAKANLKNAADQLEKLQKAYKLNRRAISQNVLDNAINAEKIAAESLKVAQSQYGLVKAGAWSYDIENQENQYKAAQQAYQADKALLDKYIVRAPMDGVVLRVGPALGDYVSSQGVYDTYTQGMAPVVTVGKVAPYLAVRCYVDEILTPKLPKPENLEAKMFIRGDSNNAIPLEFVRIQPYTTPNIELSNQKQERVDVRVLPIIFKFKKPANINLFPGQLVDVYLKGKKSNEKSTT
jgi:HlyD family secretion protein